MNEFLKSILDGIHMVIPSYGWSIVAFTILIRLVLMPLDYKSRVGMRKISKLAPKQAELQKKYAKDQEKFQRKLSELYRKEQVSPMSSCWPMLVSMPILFAMFAAMRMMANEQLVQQTFDIITAGAPTLEPFLWVKNLWMPDSPFTSAWPDLQSLNLIPEGEWLRMFNALPAETLAVLQEKVLAASGMELTAASFAGDALKSTIANIGLTLQTVPEYAANTAVNTNLTLNLLVTQMSVAVNYNGFFILPLLSAASQFLMSKINPSTAAPAATGDQAAQQNSTNNFMKWFFPLFSLWICLSYNAAFAAYWVTSNLIAMAQNYGINKYLDMKEAKAAANPEATTDVSGKGLK